MDIIMFLSFCHNSRVWQTDGSTDGQTFRSRLRMYTMERAKNWKQMRLLLNELSVTVYWLLRDYFFTFYFWCVVLARCSRVGVWSGLLKSGCTRHCWVATCLDRYNDNKTTNNAMPRTHRRVRLAASKKTKTVKTRLMYVKRVSDLASCNRINASEFAEHSTLTAPQTA